MRVSFRASLTHHEPWHCDVCGEDKTSMHGNPDSGLCLDCFEDRQTEDAIAHDEAEIEDGQARWSETGSTRKR